MRTRFASVPAYYLVELIVYLGIVAAVLGVGGDALWEAFRNSRRLNENSQQIEAVLRTGERWRREIRHASASPSTTTNSCRIRTPRGSVTYSVRGQDLVRSVSGKPDQVVLHAVKRSAFFKDPATSCQPWRWELELQSDPTRRIVVPLFTFEAVLGKAR